MRKTPPLPLPVKRALAKLGEDIRSARLRRRISTEVMAQRAFITRMTLSKVERGDPSVSLGIYAVSAYCPTLRGLRFARCACPAMRSVMADSTAVRNLQRSACSACAGSKPLLDQVTVTNFPQSTLSTGSPQRDRWHPG